MSGLLGAQQFPAKSTDPVKAALIEEMWTLTRPDKILAEVRQQYKAAFSKTFEESFWNEVSKYKEDAAKYQPALHRFENQAFGLIDNRMSWEEMKPDFVAICETFSKEELGGLVAFYKTPSGQNQLQKALGPIESQVIQVQMSNARPEIERFTARVLENLRKAHGSDAEAIGESIGSRPLR